MNPGIPYYFEIVNKKPDFVNESFMNNRWSLLNICLQNEKIRNVEIRHCKNFLAFPFQI